VYRIGELARRTGTTSDLLRIWERRYGLLKPDRTAGGFRVYSEDDAARVTAMRAGMERGLAAAESARLALAEARRPDLLDSLLAFDEEAAQTALDDAFGRLTIEGALERVVLPALRAIGDGWARGRVSVAQEHFAANLVRGRLLALARRWDQGLGPRVLLACAPGDQHDLPLIAFGLALRGRGFRIVFLGADTPVEVVGETARDQAPDLIVLASAVPRPELASEALREVAALAPLVLAGAWPPVDLDVRRVEGDPVAVAARIAVG
jgi:DNA-binding transcriptional MerR regulator